MVLPSQGVENLSNIEAASTKDPGDVEAVD
jgi:hypothetical protein